MPIDSPVSDLSRSIQHEPDTTWPTTVKIQLYWWVDGRPRIRTILIEADQFFGRGQYGAPIDGSALIGQIENMRREGPPPIPPSPGRKPNAAKKAR